MNIMRKARLIKVTAIGIAIILVLYIGLSIYGATEAMEIPRLPLNNSPASVGLDYEDVSFTSRDDGVVLRGWYIPSKRNSVIIIVHGGFQNRLDDNVDTLGLAHDLVEKGYNLLLFDLRGRGESEGKGLALSNIERDIGGAVDYLEGEGYPLKRIYIIGFCSGAVSACIFTSQNSIGALILDGCPATIHNMVTRQAVLGGIPKFLSNFFVPGVLFATNIIYDYELVNPIDIIADVTCPIFFIHEEHDELISWEEMHQLFITSSNPANEFWEVNNAEHSQSYKTHPAEYIEKVDNFISTKVEGTSLE
ncbi:alpha/beta hydrolase [Chloroflexota bacterium]